MAGKIGNKNALGNKGGKPSKYKDEYAGQAYDLALLGATDKEIAAFFKVTERTFNRWKKQVEFCHALKEGKLSADSKVARKLFQRAMGYNYDEVTFEKIDSKTNLEISSAGDIKTNDTYKKKVIVKEVVPDVTAQIFWLKNRQKAKWRERQDINSTIDVKNLLDKLSEEQLDQILQAIIKQQSGQQ